MRWGYGGHILNLTPGPSRGHISHRININNMNSYAESAESKLLIGIQGFNNCMFGKHKHL